MKCVTCHCMCYGVFFTRVNEVKNCRSNIYDEIGSVCSFHAMAYLNRPIITV